MVEVMPQTAQQGQVQGQEGEEEEPMQVLLVLFTQGEQGVLLSLVL
jgi:hypothetical protein